MTKERVGNLKINLNKVSNLTKREKIEKNINSMSGSFKRLPLIETEKNQEENKNQKSKKFKQARKTLNLAKCLNI